MPYADEEKQKEYQKEWMRDYRARKKREREKVRMAKKLGLYPQFTYEVI